MRYVFFLAFFIWMGGPALATEPLDGFFTAQANCAAFQSKNKGTNPGQVTVLPGVDYSLLGTNPPARDWVQITVPNAPATTARWVPADCGTLTLAKQYENKLPGRPAPQRTKNLVLALSWQPATCEKLTGTRECRALNAGKLPHATNQLSLHGLWPQPRDAIYCGVSSAVVGLDKRNRWDDLPALTLEAKTRNRLQRAMPGAASYLHRHEWIKHGTCFLEEASAEEYFNDSLVLLAAINRSAMGDLLAARAGKELSARALRTAADRSFGAGAGERVQLICANDGNRRLVLGIRIALHGEIVEAPDVGALMQAAPKQPTGCRSGMLDRAGLQ
ncbi:MAG: ribonuclease T [Pseudomonadota bacterium]